MANETKGRTTTSPRTAPSKSESDRPGPKAAPDKEAPHGRDAAGKPLAPHGYLDDGVTPRTRPKRDLSKLDVSMLAKPQAVSEQLAEAARPMRARSETQKVMDDIVRQAHDAWKSAGSPGEWDKIPKMRYHIPVDQASDLRLLIRKAADFHKVRARFGRAGVLDAEGNEVIVFGVVNKGKKTRKSE